MPFLLRHRLLLCTLTLTLTLTLALAEDFYRYTNCRKNFTCGNVTATFPFWGDEREAYCGLPPFKLLCDTGVPKIVMNSQEKLRILDFDQRGMLMRAARDDLWNNLCPARLLSTPAFINYTTFPLRNNPSILALFYGCTSLVDEDPGLISDYVLCANSSSVRVSARMAADPKIENPNCTSTVVIPVAGDSDAAVVQPLSFPSIVAAVDGGFSLGWFYGSLYDAYCDNCLAIGGVCGTTQPGDLFSCYCSDGSLLPNNDTFTCRSEPARVKKTMTALQVVGLAVGASLMAAGLTCLAYYLLRGRVRREVGGFSSPWSEEEDDRKSANSALFFHSSSVITSTRSTSHLGVQLFAYSDLEEATNKFEEAKELGEGGFGIVYYGKLRDGREVAVKRLFERNFKGVEQFMNEVEILTRLRHPNLVTLYGCTSRRSRELLLVYEYVPNGTVSDHLHPGSNLPSLSWPLRLAVAVQTASALAYLHATDIIHRDIKTNNILLDANFHVKLADFGISRLFPTDATHVSTAPQGTPGYVDPEYYHCYHLTEKSDVYSFGVVLVELLSSKPAVDLSRNRHDINLANMALSRIQSQTLEELVDNSLGFSSDAEVREGMTLVAELAFRCLQADREMRPCMEEVVRVLCGIRGGAATNLGDSPLSITDRPDWATTISSHCAVNTM